MLLTGKKIKKRIILVLSLFIIFSGISYSDGDISADFVGRTIFSAAQVNEEGFFMEIQLNGANFKPEISEIDRKKLLYHLEVDIDDGHIQDNSRGNKDLLALIQEKRHSVLVPVGTDAFGKPINSIDRFLSYERGIPDELEKNGEVFINDQGNLVIQCSSAYFKTLSNNIIYTDGGVPIGYGDLPIYVNIPKSMIEGADDSENESEDSEEDITVFDPEKYIKVNGYYCIVEMKARVEIFAYDDDDARNNKDIKRVHQVDHLTEEDIRAGGKLLKLTVESRNGPTNWAVAGKPDPKFINNSFRTERDYFEGAQNNPEWNKITSELGGNLEPGNEALKSWNGYWMTDIPRVSHEQTMEELRPFYYFVEFPVIKDFNIDESMVVYVNLLAGMGGGTGKSNEQGEPFWGMDGRLSFTILSGDDSDITAPTEDPAGNDEGFGAGQGDGFGDEHGEGSGSDGENIVSEAPVTTHQPQQNQQLSGSQTNTTRTATTPPRAQRVQISEPNSQNRTTQTRPVLTRRNEPDKDEPEEDPALQANAEDLSQGSAGEGVVDKESPRKVYDVSDQIKEETEIEKIKYEYEKYLAGLFVLMAIGAAVRYTTYSKYIY